MVLDRLSAEDRLMLWPDAVWPQDVGALAILDAANLLNADGSFQIHTARGAVARRLHLLPRLRQVLHKPSPGLGAPLWIDAPAFDIRNHVNVVAVPAPADETALLETVETLRRRRLDFAKPLWEIWFLTGLVDGRVGMFIRLHHVVGDGMAGIAALAALLDPEPDAPVVGASTWSPGAMPSRWRLLVDNSQQRGMTLRSRLGTLRHPGEAVRHVARAWPVVRELVASEPGPRTSLSHVIGAGRTTALIRSSVDDMRRVGHAHDATINDVLLTATAGGIRQLLISRGEAVENLMLPIYVPVSLRREASGEAGGNLISQMVVPLPVGIADVEKRLRFIAAETAARKAMARPSLGAIFRSKLLAGVTLKLVARQQVNVVSANIPGPPMPLYFAGARMLEVFPMVNLIGTVSLGVAGMSYAGQFNIMANADADTYPDLGVLAAGVRSDLKALSAMRPAEPELQAMGRAGV